MKYASRPTLLCAYRERPDAACRRLPRCRRCGRALSFNERDVCRVCLATPEQKAVVK